MDPMFPRRPHTIRGLRWRILRQCQCSLRCASSSGAPPTYFNDGGGGVRVNFLGLKFWPKVIFWVYERRQDFLGREKKRDFLGLRNKD